MQRVQQVPVGQAGQADRVEKRRLPDCRAAIVRPDLELKPGATGPS